MNRIKATIIRVCLAFTGVGSGLRAAESSSVRLLGADPARPLFHVLLNEANEQKYRWQERVIGDPGQTLSLAPLGLRPVARELVAPAVTSLADLLREYPARYGLARPPLRVVLVPLFNKENRNERQYLTEFATAFHTQVTSAWRSAGVRVEVVNPKDIEGDWAPFSNVAQLAGNGVEEGTELAGLLAQIQQRLDREAVLRDEVQYVSHVVVVWAENKLKMPANAAKRPATQPARAQVTIVNVANATPTVAGVVGLNPRPAMQAYAATAGFRYHEVRVDIEGEKRVERQWPALAGQVASDVAAYFGGFRIVSLSSEFVQPERARRFVATRSGSEQELNVLLSQEGQGKLQDRALASFATLLRGEPATTYPTATGWLAVFDATRRARAVEQLGNYLAGGSLARWFASGEEAEAVRLLAAFKASFREQAPAVRRMEAALDDLRKRQFEEFIKAKEYGRAEQRLNGLSDAAKAAALRNDFHFHRGLARVRGDSFSDGADDLKVWYGNVGSNQMTAKTVEAAHAILSAGVLRRPVPEELMTQWFGRLRMVMPKLAPEALASAGRWLGEASDLRLLLERAVGVGDIQVARTALQSVSGAAERSGWLEFTLGNPEPWRRIIAQKAADGSAADRRLYAGLVAVEAAKPVAETFAALYQVAPDKARQALQLARASQIQSEWVARSPQAEIVDITALPFARKFVDHALRAAPQGALCARRETTTGAGTRVWFEYYRPLNGDRFLRMELIGNFARGSEQAADLMKSSADRHRLLEEQRFIAMRDGVMMATGLLGRGYFLIESLRDCRPFVGPGGVIFAGVPTSWLAYAVLNRPLASVDSRIRLGAGPNFQTEDLLGLTAPQGDGRDLAQTDFIVSAASAAAGSGGRLVHLGAAFYESVLDPQKRPISAYRGVLRVGLKFTPQ